MKFNNSIRAIPIISTFLLILILSISNQKENTKLKILIWNTPSLSLGYYIAISTSTGFILGYSINLIIGNLIHSKEKKQFTFNNNYQYEQSKDDIDKPTKPKYDNTLIERNIKDPSPTITADFRIISRNEDSYNEYESKNIQNDELFQNEVKFGEKSSQNKANKNYNSECADWYDQSFSDW
tara:strand:- start:647 stop:1189 length:543 start_codon:yes stop_codon:yes gene_type:complete